MKEVLLRLEDLSIGYGSKVLIQSIHTSVYTNEFIVILGKNGVGKTTLLHTLLGFEPALSGQLYYGKRKSTEISAHDLAKKVAVVFPKANYIPKIKVKEAILSARLAHHRVLKKYTAEEFALVEELMALVGISFLQEQYLTEISEGQLQLVMIARALCQETPLIFLDEPTANLDLENQFKMYELIKKLKQETEKTFVMITHDAEFALNYADRVWWIEEQQLFDGLPEEIAYTHQLIPKLSGGYLSYHSATQAYQAAMETVHQLKVIGESEWAHWVKKALERKGFIIHENSVNFVEVLADEIHYRNHRFSNITSFLNHIEHEKYNHNRSE